MENNTVLVIGDVAIDVFITPQVGETMAQMKEQEKYICFSYGDKIPVDHLEFLAGGNAANVSIGLQRLGIPTSILTSIGADNVSKVIYNELQQEHVDTQFVTIQPGTTANYSTIISYQGERTIFTYHAPKTYTYHKQQHFPSFVYLTSMGEKFLPFYQDVIHHLDTTPDVTLMFNPGSLQKRANIEDIHMVLKRTNVLFVNREEAEIFSGFKKSEGNEKKVLEALQTLGPKTVIMTDNEKGAYTTNGTEFLKISVIPVAVVEKTGAGDAFNSGYIAAMLKHLPFEQCIQWGTMNAASVIGYVGAQKGLLHMSDIDAWKRMYTDANVTVQPL